MRDPKLGVLPSVAEHPVFAARKTRDTVLLTSTEAAQRLNISVTVLDNMFRSTGRLKATRTDEPCGPRFSQADVDACRLSVVPEPDPLAGGRGMVSGFLLGTLFWCAVIGLGFAVAR